MENEEMRELEQGIAHTEQVKKCAHCKYILLFAFIALLLVMVVVFLQSTQGDVFHVFKPAEKPFHSIAPTKEDIASTTAEYNQRILELGQTLNINSAPNDVQPTTTASGGMPMKSQNHRPDGPPPLAPPVY